MPLLETGRRIALRYETGQFSFRHFDNDATDEQLYNLAGALNAFQTDAAENVLKVVVSLF